MQKLTVNEFISNLAKQEYPPMMEIPKYPLTAFLLFSPEEQERLVDDYNNSMHRLREVRAKARAMIESLS